MSGGAFPITNAALDWLSGSEATVHHSLRSFLRALEQRGDLLPVSAPVSPELEMTALARCSLREGGPALRFDRVPGYQHAVIANLFGASRRVAQAVGLESVDELRHAGELLTYFKSPTVPTGLADGLKDLRQLSRLRQTVPQIIPRPPCQEQVLQGAEVDLARLPLATCWPEDIAPLLSFGLVITKGPDKPRTNLAIYRQQPIGPNRLIMRWLPHRGGALDYRDWCRAHPDRPFPVAVAIGADPACTVAAVAPIPDTLSEYQFAGLLRGARSQVARCLSHELEVPASSEIVLEGFIHPGDVAPEGPFCDHTGHYNAVQEFPVFTVERMTMREQALYHTTYMGRPPEDEPSVLAAALNEMFVPLIRDQFPEIQDFYLPPAACSYRVAVVSIRKQYPGHARRIMMGVWSYLRQFTYTKFVIVTDDDVDVRDSDQLLWALSTRCDPVRDTLLVPGTPIDYLDFASPEASVGGKLGLDATRKWPGETDREWGRVAHMDAAVEDWAEALWRSLQQQATKEQGPDPHP
jgi:4-hydroxy-3-polyprenylbenzoate decarboxylase